MAKILIIRLTSLGDVIFTLPLVCSIKEHKDNHQIGYLVAEKGIEVIKNNPSIDKIHFVPLKEWKKRPFSPKTFFEFCKLIKELRTEKYDIALDCQQMFKSLFLFMFCGAKRRITFKDARELSILAGNEFITPKAPFVDFDYHIVERNLDFARHLNIEPKIIFSLPEPSLAAKEKINELTKDLTTDKPIVVISPATTWDNKHWAEKNWAKILKQLNNRCNIVITGTNFDKKLVERLLNLAGEEIKHINLVGKTSVEELRELFSRAKIVISPDSGSAHLAWASQNPAVIAIFTCTPPRRFGPFDYENKKYFSISGVREPEEYKTSSCQPCFKKKCTNRQADEKNICKQYPRAEEIMNIVNQLLT